MQRYQLIRVILPSRNYVCTVLGCFPVYAGVRNNQYRISFIEEMFFEFLSVYVCGQDGWMMSIQSI